METLPRRSPNSPHLHERNGDAPWFEGPTPDAFERAPHRRELALRKPPSTTTLVAHGGLSSLPLLLGAAAVLCGKTSLGFFFGLSALLAVAFVGVFFGLSVMSNPWLKRTERLTWFLGTIFAAPLAMPAYWKRHIWDRRPSRRST